MKAGLQTVTLGLGRWPSAHGCGGTQCSLGPTSEGRMLRPQVRLVLLIQALGLRACNTPGRGERGHLELQHLPREPQHHCGPRVAEQDTAPTGGAKGRKGTPTLAPDVDGGHPLRCQALREGQHAPACFILVTPITGRKWVA